MLCSDLRQYTFGTTPTGQAAPVVDDRPTERLRWAACAECPYCRHLSLSGSLRVAKLAHFGAVHAERRTATSRGVWIEDRSQPYCRRVPYWTGVKRRVMPAALVGLVVGLTFGLLWGWTSGLIVGGATFLSALLLPTKQPGRSHPSAAHRDVP